MIRHEANEEDWKPGKHEWGDRLDCLVCGARRLDNGDFYIYRMPESLDSTAREVWERACPPCRPRTDVIKPGLHTAKGACELMGMRHGTFVNRVATRWMRPFAVLLPRTYLWSDRQLDLIYMTDDEWGKTRAPVIPLRPWFMGGQARPTGSSGRRGHTT